MKRSYFLFILALALALFNSCEEAITPVNDQVAPELPSTALYSMPMTVDGDTVEKRLGDYKNWLHAGGNVLVWNTAIVLNVAVPIAAMGRAFEETPVFVGNSTFEWSYVFRAPHNIGGKTYDVVLSGQYLMNNQEVAWTMSMSERGGFSNFEWFSGIVAIDQTSANWMLNHQPNNPQPYMSIAATQNPANTDGSIRYTSEDTSNPGVGGYIEFRVESANQFNRSYDVQGGANDPTNLLQIQWSVPTNEGRVKHPAFFNDSDWHCWDKNLKNTAC